MSQTRKRRLELFGYANARDILKRYRTMESKSSSSSRDGRMRRRSTRRRSSSFYQILRSRTLGGLTPRFRVPMAYTATFVMGDATVTNGIQVFRLNSVWDPDYSGVGVTVTGYSTFAALYGRYFVHGSKVSVEASIRDESAVTVNAGNIIMGCSVSDYVPASPATGVYDTELTLEQHKLRYMPRGASANGGLYRMNYTKASRSNAGLGFSGIGQSINYKTRRGAAMGGFAFKDKRRYKLHDPLATLTTGGFLEHEQEGEFPLTGAAGATPIDNVFMGCWAFSILQNNETVQPLPYVYWTVRIVMDVEWYAPIGGVAAPSTAAAGAGAGLDGVGAA